MAYITIVKGDDTDFLDNQYLVVNFNTDVELSGFQAVLKLGAFELIYPDLSAKYLEIVLSKDITSALPKGKIYGTLQLVDTENRVRTLSTVLPFNVVTKVLNSSEISKQSIQLDVKIEHNEITVDMNILGLSKTVAESYLNQMKQSNSQMIEKVQAMKIVEANVADLAKSTNDNSILAQKWASADGLVDGKDYSAKSYAQHAKVELQEFLDNANSSINSKIDENIENMGAILTRTEDIAQEAIDTVSNTLDKSQITNCLLEVPQRVKYELADGVLTIKKGSQVIVPYGVTDLTTQYPVGSTFLHENFKVVHTQYQDGKFFVWVETLSDKNFTFNDTNERTYSVCIRPNTNTYSAVVKTFSGSNFGTLSGQYYNTQTNIISYIKNGQINGTETNLSLPLLRISGDGKVIRDNFNGFGYIGSTIWVDKDVKALVSNGRNDDGSLCNIEIDTNNILTLDLSSDINITDSGSFLLNNSASAIILSRVSYDKNTNYLLLDDGITKVSACIFANSCSINNGIITAFNPILPFRVVEASEFNPIQERVNNTKRYVVDTYINGSSWFNIYSDGWKEQGGQVTGIAAYSFLKPFSNTDYTFVSNSSLNVTKANDGFNITDMNLGTSAKPSVVDWYACGN